MQRLSGLNEDADIVRLSARLSQAAARHDDLVLECLEIDNELARWYASIEKNYTTSLYWEQPSGLCAHLPASSPERVFPAYIHFANVDLGQDITLYWTGRLLVRMAKEFSKMWIVQTFPKDMAETRKGESEDMFNAEAAYGFARKIAQSLEYFLQPEAGLAGLQSMTLPMMMAKMVFARTQHYQELAWLRVIEHRLAQMNVKLEDFMKDMANGKIVRLIR